MNLKGSISQLNPLLKLAVLLILIFVNMLILQFIALGVFGNFTDWNIQQYRLIVVLSPVFNLIVPGLIFYYLNFNNKGVSKLGFKNVQNIYWIALIPLFLLIIQSIPVIVNTNEVLFNLLGLQELVNSTADNYESNILMFIKDASASDMAINIIGIAFLTAIGEEIVFRGILQKLICKFTKNMHFGILLSAFIFSLVHWEFSGFLNRMFLGLVYGYIVVYSGSLFIVMILHFLNNAIGIIGMWYVTNYATQQELAEVANQSNDGVKIIPIISLLLLSGLLYYFKVNSKEDLSTY